MTIATYNLRQGGPKRVHWSKLVGEHAADLLLVQESYAPDEHVPPLLHAGARERSAWASVPGRRWGSAVYCARGSLRPVPVPGFDGWVAGAEVDGIAARPDGESGPLMAFSVHAPAAPDGYARQIHRVLDAIAQIATGRLVVIGGDFNLSVTDACGSDRVVSAADLAVQARLADEFGLMNCWRAANPGRPPCQTLRWARDPATAYHCDGLFVPRAWAARLRSCVVPSGPEWDGLSDHNPVVACLA